MDNNSNNAKQNPQAAPGVDNAQKDPADWVTKDEAMTGAQASYLKTLSEAANETFDAKLTKAEASKKIEALKRKTAG